MSGSKSANIGGVNVTVDWLSAVPQSPTPTARSTYDSHVIDRHDDDSGHGGRVNARRRFHNDNERDFGHVDIVDHSDTSAAEALITSAQDLAAAAQNATDDRRDVDHSATTGGTSSSVSNA